MQHVTTGIATLKRYKFFEAVLLIRDILLRIHIRRSVPLTNGSGSRIRLRIHNTAPKAGIMLSAHPDLAKETRVFSLQQAAWARPQTRPHEGSGSRLPFFARDFVYSPLK